MTHVLAVETVLQLHLLHFTSAVTKKHIYGMMLEEKR